jgi:hypothetical protein
MAVTEYLTRASLWVPEQSTWQYVTTIVDERGIFVSSTALTTLTLTLQDLSNIPALPLIIDHRSIKNTGGGVVTSVGVLTLTLPPADTILLVGTNAYERRYLLLEWTYAAGVKALAKEVFFVVKRVPNRA